VILLRLSLLLLVLLRFMPLRLPLRGLLVGNGMAGHMFDEVSQVTARVVGCVKGELGRFDNAADDGREEVSPALTSFLGLIGQPVRGGWLVLASEDRRKLGK
jgi:hypothetical protein